MNKKLLIALMLPLMLIPLTSFAYAHWTDKVTKQIKLHAGTVEVEIVQFHVDTCNSYDVSCDGVIYFIGDYPKETDPDYDPTKKYELIIEMVKDPEGEVIEVYITADPVFPCWELEFKMLIHNKGRLAVASDIHNWNWIGPLDEDPCWLVPQPYPNDRFVPECITYEEGICSHNYLLYPECAGKLCTDKTHYCLPESETAYVLKPSQCILLREYIHFDSQLHPEVQCKWFRLAKELGFKEYVPLEPWSSAGWVKPD